MFHHKEGIFVPLMSLFAATEEIVSWKAILLHRARSYDGNGRSSCEF